VSAITDDTPPESTPPSNDWAAIVLALKGWLDARIELLKLDVEDRLATIEERIGQYITALVGSLLAVLVVALSLVFFSIGLALYLAAVLGSAWAGFVVTGTVLAGVAFLIHLSTRRRP
jgi:hypothetical protein